MSKSINIIYIVIIKSNEKEYMYLLTKGRLIGMLYYVSECVKMNECVCVCATVMDVRMYVHLCKRDKSKLRLIIM